MLQVRQQFRIQTERLIFVWFTDGQLSVLSLENLWLLSLSSGPNLLT
jgi:hypothetical protein